MNLIKKVCSDIYSVIDELKICRERIDELITQKPELKSKLEYLRDTLEDARADIEHSRDTLEDARADIEYYDIEFLIEEVKKEIEIETVHPN